MLPDRLAGIVKTADSALTRRPARLPPHPAIDLRHEYALLQREHGFTREDFARCNAVAAAQSFLPEANTILNGAGHPA